LSIKKIFLIRFLFPILILIHTDLLAQQTFERRAVTVSNLGISYTNVGTIGNPNIRTVPSGVPSMEYPKDSGTEHLFEAGIWLGALVDGQVRVSSSAVTNSAGYQTGAAGFEFTNAGQLFNVRSSLEESSDFSPVAISHEDLISQFTDKNTAVGNVPIAGHDNPLFADIQMESYNWNFGFTEALSIIKYEVTNNGAAEWNDLYFSLYSDMVVRNVNTTLETGGAFFNKGGMGWLDDEYALYVFDRGSTDEKQNTYAANVILGSEYRGIEFHPRRAEEIIEAGFDAPSVSPDFWLFNTGAGEFSRPNDDLERYTRMSTEWPLDSNRERLRNDGYPDPVNGPNGNFIQLNTIGPFPNVAVGEKVIFYIAYVTALMPENYRDLVPANEADVDDFDNVESRANLVENIGWAYRLFDGQENSDGSRERFLVPEPPKTPNMRVELTGNSVNVFWDKNAEDSIDPVTEIQDFAGYKLYRTELGDDLNGSISSSAKVLREWDIQGDEIGFETGLSEIELSEPKIFPDSDIEYNYKFEIKGMLSGWQYLFSVSAFDQGDDRTPPLETSINANAVRIFPGTPINENFNSSDNIYEVGVYPNPYRVNAAWDGTSSLTRKIMFYNLPEQAEIRVYTLAGEMVAKLDHNANTYTGDTRWFSNFSSNNRILPGGEHAWDLLSEANQNLATGLYLYTVYNKQDGHVQRGKFVIIK